MLKGHAEVFYLVNVAEQHSNPKRHKSRVTLILTGIYSSEAADLQYHVLVVWSFPA